MATYRDLERAALELHTALRRTGNGIRLRLITKEHAMPTTTSPWQTLYAGISAHQRTHPGTTSAQAMTAVLTAHPDLAADIRQLERQGQRPPAHLLKSTSPSRPTARPQHTGLPDAENRAWQILKRHAEQLLADGTVPTFAQGVDRACQQHPDVLAEYHQIRKGDSA